MTRLRTTTPLGMTPMALWLGLGLTVGSGCTDSVTSRDYRSFKEVNEAVPRAPALVDAAADDSGHSAKNPGEKKPGEDPRDPFLASSINTPVASVTPPTQPAGQFPEAFANDPEAEIDPRYLERPLSAVNDLLIPGKAPKIAHAAATGPREIKLLVEHRDFRKEGPDGALRVSYDDLDLLKILNMEPVPVDAVSHFPDWLKGLSGKRIRIRGFMFPTFEQSGLDRFVMARDNDICCFGRDPKIYDLIGVRLRTGKTTNYIANRPFDVVGTLRMELLMEGDKPFGLWFLDDAIVMAR